MATKLAEPVGTGVSVYAWAMADHRGEVDGESASASETMETRLI